MSDSSISVCFVTRKWPPAIGGMETYSKRLADELSRMVDLQVIALPGRKSGLPPSWISLLLFPFTIIRQWFARPRKPDILHLGDMAIWPAALLAGLLRGRTRVLISAHGTDVSFARRKSMRGSIYAAYLRLGARLLRDARIIANSRATAEAAAETGWTNAWVIPLATDLGGARPDGTHTGRILFCGRLIELKGCKWFVQNVLPKLPDQVEVDVAGTIWDEGEASILSHPQVRYLGFLTGEELVAAYRSALCTVIPNIPLSTGQFEGFGLVAPEAAASGGLVLASNHGGLADAVIDGKSGFLLPAGDADAWAAKIAKISRWSEAHRREFLEKAQRTVADDYAWSTVASRTLSAYRDLLAER